MQLAGLYAKNYAPYELVRDLFGFDMYNVQPWLDQVAASQTDIEFLDICTKYVASLQDSHDEFISPTIYEAYLPFDVDIYDGKILVGAVYSSSRRYPLQVGDELVSVNGVAAMDQAKAFIPYAANGGGNPISQMRLAAASVVDRLQAYNPLAGQIQPGDNATVVLNHNSNTVTYTIPWTTISTPLTTVGLVPSPQAESRARVDNTAGQPRPFQTRRGGKRRNPAWGTWQGAPAQVSAAPVPDYMQTLMTMRHLEALAAPGGVNAVGLDPFSNPDPLFNPPSGFKLRLGAKATDQFLSGTFPVGNYTIGFIRIANMLPPDETTALNQFSSEIQYFQQNTDGLVVDIMGNGGGDGCYTEELASALIPISFRGLAQELRATPFWLEQFQIALFLAQSEGAPGYAISLYQSYVAAIQQALSQNRGLTGSLPVCDYTFSVSPLMDSKGNNLAYSKPILVLTDSFTVSAAEIFAMFLQDSQRATIFGMRTDGGGGNVVEFDYNATDYSQGSARVTFGLITRAQPVATPGFPLGPYSIFYDGMGIYPDIVEDYQTTDNLLNGGATFVTDASTAISNLIQKAAQH